MAKEIEKKGSTALQLKQPVPVSFVEPSLVFTDEWAFPSDMQKEGEINVAPTSLSPTADWQTIGEGVDAIYLGTKMEVGPFGSRLYAFQLHTGEFVSVWGGAVLDDRMDALRPEPGDRVGIIYIGDGEKKPGRNAPRLFKVGKITAAKR